MPLQATVRDLLEAGVHFGHLTARWNPKMKRFIFEARNGIHIIDLRKTMVELNTAYDFVKGQAARGRKILFVGTKKQSKEAIKEAAKRCGMYYVNERWLGGLLTNFETLKTRIKYFKKISAIIKDGTIDRMPGKEASSLRREWTKLDRNIGGIQDITELPGAIFIVDPTREAIAVNEARKTGVPVVAIADTNCNPDKLDYPIPGNDDSIRTVTLLADIIASAALEGKKNIVVTAPPTPVVTITTPEKTKVAKGKKQAKKEPTAAKHEITVPGTAGKE